jgi:hypothetical protein
MFIKDVWIKSLVMYPADRDGKPGVQCDVLFCDDSSLIGQYREGKAWDISGDVAIQKAFGNVCHLWSSQFVMLMNSDVWTRKYHKGEVYRLNQGPSVDLFTEQLSQDKM